MEDIDYMRILGRGVAQRALPCVRVSNRMNNLCMSCMLAGIWAAECGGSSPAAGGIVLLLGAGQDTDEAQALLFSSATSQLPQPVH